MTKTYSITEEQRKEEVDSGEHDGYVFVHDNVSHDDDDIDALTAGIN